LNEEDLRLERQAVRQAKGQESPQGEAGLGLEFVVPSIAVHVRKGEARLESLARNLGRLHLGGGQRQQPKQDTAEDRIFSHQGNLREWRVRALNHRNSSRQTRLLRDQNPKSFLIIVDSAQARIYDEAQQE